jgi:hypothetical protein
MFNAIGNYIGAVSGVATNLSLGVSTISFDESNTLGAAGASRLVSPKILWHDGKTYFGYQHTASDGLAETTTTGGRLSLIIYDEQYGLSRPIGILNRQSDYDTHHTPTWYVDQSTGRVFIIMEKHHNVSPLQIIKNRTIGDDFIWQVSSTTIGTNPVGAGYPTYPNNINRGGIFSQIIQTDNVDAGYLRNSSGSIEGAWSAEVKMTTRDAAAGENMHYVALPFNHQAFPGDKIVWVNGGRTTGELWFNKYLHKALITAGGITHYDFDESFSKASKLTSAEQYAHFRYFNTANTNQAYGPVSCVDVNGNYYDITGDGTATGYNFIYWLNGTSAHVSKTVSLPGSPTLLNGASQGESAQNGAVVLTWAVSSSEVYAFFRQQEGAFVKVILYKTVNLGDSWVRIGDWFSDVNDNIFTIDVPSNFQQIPSNRNFIVVAKALKNPTYSQYYFKKAAWGTIQTETGGNPYTAVTAYTEAEYNALMVRSYFIETGKITNTGTTCNSIIDQSPSGVNVNSSGSPVLNSSVTPAYVTMDGSNDFFSIPTTGLTALTEGTIIAVGRLPSGSVTSGAFLNASKNTVTNQFRNWSWATTDRIRNFQTYGGVSASVDGHTALDRSNFYIFVWTHQNNGCGVMKFVNGELQINTYTSESDKEGRFLSDFSGEQ